MTELEVKLSAILSALEEERERDTELNGKRQEAILGALEIIMKQQEAILQKLSEEPKGDNIADKLEPLLSRFSAELSAKLEKVLKESNEELIAEIAKL